MRKRQTETEREGEIKSKFQVYKEGLVSLFVCLCMYVRMYVFMFLLRGGIGNNSEAVNFQNTESD